MATKKSTTATLATLPASVSEIKQTDLPGMLKIVDAKIAELQGSNKEDDTVTEELPGFGKISSITDPLTLRYAYATVRRKVDVINAHNDVFKGLAPTIPVKEYKEAGVSTDKWEKTILTQYKKVVFKEELEKLIKVKDKIQQNLSQEDKMRADLQDALQILGVPAV